MNPHPDLILGLDAGTSVVKAALFDRQGRELAVVRRPTPLYSPQPTWSETSMQATWAMAAEAIRTLLAVGPRRQSLLIRPALPPSALPATWWAPG